MSVRSRWLKNYDVARGWSAKWRARYIAHPTAENKAKLVHWRTAADYAKRVLARHPAPSPAATSVSAEGVHLVAMFEGFRSKPYRDAVGVWTIGYGETRGIGPGTPPISQTDAARLLWARLNRDYLPPVLAAAEAGGLTLGQNEVDALTSLAYNLGGGVFSAGHSIGDALRAGSRSRAAAAILIYNQAGGHVLPGLTRRRQAERALFLKG